MYARSTLICMARVWSSACQQPPSTEGALSGAWSIQEIEVTSAGETTVTPDPQPGLAIFTESNYSLVWMPGITSLRAFEERWVPTDAEKIQRYGEIVVNSGTYTVGAESSITLRPTVSRVPEFMGGGTMLAEYRVVGDTLWYTQVDEYSFDGVQTPGAAEGGRVTLRFTRAELLQP